MLSKAALSDLVGDIHSAGWIGPFMAFKCGGL